MIRRQASLEFPLSRPSRRVFSFGKIVMRHCYDRASEFSPGGVLFGIIDQLRPGDVLAVPAVDHIAMRWSDLEHILSLLAQRSASLEVRHTARKRGESPETGFKRDLRRAAIHRAQSLGRYRGCG